MRNNSEIVDSSARNGFARVVPTLCFFVVCILLVAGLWPFHVPANEVTWLQDRSGLRFGRYGTAYSDDVLRIRPQDCECSLELWLEPNAVDTEGTIVAIDSSPDQAWPFALREYRQVLAVRRYAVDEKGIVRRPGLWLDNVFRTGKKTLVALTSRKGTTTVYVNGSPIEESSSLGLACKDLIGRLILANSTVDDSWAGQILGLAVYDKPLTAQEVAEHHNVGTPVKEPGPEGKEGLVALYLFNEGSGTVVHNQIGSGADLSIPARYTVLHPGFLRPLWSQQSYYATRPWVRWGYWKDLAVNIFGFVPLGFLFFAYFSTVRRTQKSAVIVVLIGFAISLAIEVGQRFLPTRDSGMLDLVTNTLGTALGIVFFRFYSRMAPAGMFGSIRTAKAHGRSPLGSWN
jgi:VanZ family protein